MTTVEIVTGVVWASWSPWRRGSRGDDYPIGPVDTAHGDREAHLLWPDGAPGAVGSEAVDKPKLTVYRAPADKAQRRGRRGLPRWRLRRRGRRSRGQAGGRVAELVRRHRVRPPVPARPALPPPGAAPGRTAGHSDGPGAAKEFGVDPAGSGYWASRPGAPGLDHGDALRRRQDRRPRPIDRMGSRPDFTVLIYPVITFTPPWPIRDRGTSLLGPTRTRSWSPPSRDELQVTAETPPTFLVHTSEDDGVPPENSVLFYEALQKAKVPAEMHIFAKGKHGLGLGAKDSGLSSWPRLCAAWMGEMGFLRNTR